MKRLTGLLLISALILACAGATQAITRVAPKMNVLEFHGGVGMPQGTYDELVGTEFLFDPNERVEFDADQVYDNGFYMGLGYGRVFGGHWNAVFGFDFAQCNVKDPIEKTIGIYQYSIDFTEPPTWRSYDLSARVLYGLFDLVESPASPYLGVGLTGGLSTLSAKGFDNQSNATYAVSAEFGLDVKLWHDVEERSLMTLSSINSYEFAASGDRARLLRIGLGIKYFFRP